MPIVESFDDILANVRYLDGIRCNPQDPYYAKYKAKISNGQVFFSHPSTGGLVFSPAKFIGNKDNNLSIPPSNLHIGGGRARREIEEIVDTKAEENHDIDRIFSEFCDLLGIENNNQRKYWVYDKLPDEFKKKILDFLYSESNQIYFGPPGTGKTHQTAIKAIEICLGANKANQLRNDRSALMKEYQDLADLGRIELITFHQSLSYQEFVEGLRPTTENVSNGSETSSGFNLRTHNGIFKEICNRAGNPLQLCSLNQNNTIYQILVNFPMKDKNFDLNKFIKDSRIFTDISKNIDWSKEKCDDKSEFNDIWAKKVGQVESSVAGAKDQFYEFRYGAKIGDYIVLQSGKTKLVAIGVITGQYEYVESDPNGSHKREVKWIWFNRDGVNLSDYGLESVSNNVNNYYKFYKLMSKDIKWNNLDKLLNSEQISQRGSNTGVQVTTSRGSSRFSGMLLKALKPTNPRTKYHAGKVTHGWKSFEILLKHPDGILYEDFRFKDHLIEGENVCGRREDIWKDIERGNAIAEDVSPVSTQDKLDPNFVLIIDEINRANISKVFGELITLLEVDKRLGAQNELKVSLPYSGEQFGVPRNLHIIGTMNTADRSIALLDKALRRRFKFEELIPEPELVSDKIILGDGYLRDLFIRMNNRIEYHYDREHQIGHAYFMDCVSINDVSKVLREKVIPLLADYFYNDRSKIAEVLENNIPNSSHDNFDGCFFNASRIPIDGLRQSNQGSVPEPKLRWTVKPHFDYGKLKFHE